VAFSKGAPPHELLTSRPKGRELAFRHEEPRCTRYSAGVADMPIALPCFARLAEGMERPLGNGRIHALVLHHTYPIREFILVLVVGTHESECFSAFERFDQGIVSWLAGAAEVE
jgi:hypothetical protein